jgi:molybdopterin-guanine dinucleotide biosynthesis protein A
VAVVDGHASALCGVYRSRIATDAQALLDSGERRVMRLLDRVQTKRVDAAAFRDIDPDLRSFLSCDTPEAYQAALKLKT